MRPLGDSSGLARAGDRPKAAEDLGQHPEPKVDDRWYLEKERTEKTGRSTIMRA
jgi:hypothetical protein